MVWKKRGGWFVVQDGHFGPRVERLEPAAHRHDMAAVGPHIVDDEHAASAHERFVGELQKGCA
jgi:hypothetical protein